MSTLRKSLTVALLPLLIALPTTSAIPCTTIMVKQYDKNGNVVNVINARNMDFEQQIFFSFGFGAKGEYNISDVNFYKGLPNSKVASWSNTHKFVGRLSVSKSVVVDGMNDAGVWAGALFLPNFTTYPEYDSNDQRPALSAMDGLNFVLGTANSVKDAIRRLKQVQIVNSAVQVEIDGITKFINMPLHVIIRDKTGDAAVVEYIDGKVQITSGPDIDAVTNGPSYRWNLKNFEEQTSKFVKYNTTEKWDGQYMNGSGLEGVGASYVSPDRFVLTKQLLKFSPKASTANQAFAVAEGVIDKLKGSFGQTPSPTLWTSVADLGNNIYYFKPYVALGLTGKDGMKAVLAENNSMPGSYEAIHLDQIPNQQSVKEFVRVRTTRDIKYVDPSSPNVSYSKGVLPGASYDVKFLRLKQFTTELINKYLFN